MNDRDDFLLRRARKGDKRAFSQLVNRYRDSILYLAYDFLHDYETARDVAQDVFFKAYRNLGHFEKRSKFSTWLYRITINTCLDAKRRESKKPQSTRLKEADVLPSKDRSAQNLDRGVDDNLATAIAQLSENQKTAIIMRFFQDHTIFDIAEIMGCSESTVRIHLHRGLKKLTALIKQKGIAD